MTLTLVWSHPYALTSLEEHRAFFDQGRPLLEPTIHHHEVFSTITPEKHSIFFQALKGSKWVNSIKGAYAQYYNNSTFGILTNTFIHENLPRTTRILLSVISPDIKKISDNIYHYFPLHCANGEPQV